MIVFAMVVMRGWYCSNCGAYNSDDAEYCTSCGEW